MTTERVMVVGMVRGNSDALSVTPGRPQAFISPQGRAYVETESGHPLLVSTPDSFNHVAVATLEGERVAVRTENGDAVQVAGPEGGPVPVAIFAATHSGQITAVDSSVAVQLTWDPSQDKRFLARNTGADTVRVGFGTLPNGITAGELYLMPGEWLELSAPAPFSGNIYLRCSPGLATTVYWVVA